jgi:alkylation response protein AidB-like acyl-CoA dehydrogenase
VAPPIWAAPFGVYRQSLNLMQSGIMTSMSSSVESVRKQPVTGDELVARARELVPLIREHAAESERLTHIAPAVIEAMGEAGLFATMVPKRFGGHGLGHDTLAYIARELAHGDSSTAWSGTFLIMHNWLICRFLPLEAQEELYADRNYVLAAGPIGPTRFLARLERVDGGFLVTSPAEGFPYASGLMHSDWTMVGGRLDGADGPETYALLVARKDLTVYEDSWQFSGMAATGSVTSTCENAFVPDRFTSSLDTFYAATDHPGAVHEETWYRYSLGALSPSGMAKKLGSLERMVELARERLETTRAFGTPRIEQAQSRIRWAEAHQTMRVAQIMFEYAVNRAVNAGEGEWPDEFSRQSALDGLWMSKTCLDTARLIVDGAGTSALALKHPLQRYYRDMTVMANHAATDYDYMADVGAKRILELDGGTPYQAGLL